MCGFFFVHRKGISTVTVSTINSVAEFVTNGVTKSFPFYFKFLESKDLVVTYISPEGTSSDLVMGTHYTVAGAGNENGGSVLTVSALAGPGQLIVSRDMEAYQQTSLRNQGKFLAETHEDVFDRLTMLIQQGFSIFRRALTRPFGREFFFAESRRIASVADPVDLQDAATKISVERYVGKVIASGQGPINNAANIVFVGADGIPGTVQDLSSSVGANMLGYLNGSIGSALGRRASIEEGPYSIFDDGRDETAGLQQNIDAHVARGVKYIWLERMYNVKMLMLKTEGVQLVAGNNNAGFRQLESHNTAHSPTIWLPRSGCELQGVKFRYAVWDETNMASLRSSRPGGGFSLNSCHIAVGYSEIYTARNTGVPNQLFGQTLGVVYGSTFDDIDILGAAVHGINLQNSVGATVRNLKSTQVKGTTVYGFIAPNTTVEGGNITSTCDDAIYIGGSDGHLGGVWTPIKQSDMRNIRMSGLTADKIGAKVYSASGYDTVVIRDCLAGSSRAALVHVGSEQSQGIRASSNVLIDNVRGSEVFGGFGTGADGFGYSTDLVTAGAAFGFAFDLSGCDGFKVVNNRAVKSPKVATLTQLRGGFGFTEGYKNGKIYDNDLVNFPKNNIGLEVANTSPTSAIKLRDNDFSDTTQGSDVVLLNIGNGALAIQTERNNFSSIAGGGAGKAGMYLSAGSHVVSTNDEFNMPYNLSKYDTSAGPALFSTVEPADIILREGRPGSIGGNVRWGDSAPAYGIWSEGDVVHNRAPTAAKNISHWICRAGGSSAQWSAVGAGFGTDAQRPILTGNDLGYIYKNTSSNTLQFWSGGAWV